MILRFCVCIPTYNNPKTIESTVRECLEVTAFPVLIVDDGSDVPVEELLLDPLVREARTDGRLSVIRFATNRGKGLALQAAIRESVRRGFTHLLSIDGDGQHLPQEISKLVRAAVENPWSLIIGNRKFDADTVPEASKIGRRFSNFWVHFQTDTKIADSQSGFRIYPLFHLQNIRFFTRRFDFEIEVMIRLLWRGVSIHEVEIAVYYPRAEERVSHFNKLWDNVRISILNTVLVALSLLRAPHSPLGIAWAVGVGVWVGCTPFLGFHTAIVLALSFLVRLNVIYLWLGTQISIPPLAPFLAMGSIHLGSYLTGRPLGTASGFSLNWLVGSLGVGAVLGLLIGVGSYFVALRLSGPPVKAGWNGKTRGGKFGNGFLKSLLKRFGLAPAYFTLYFIVPYFYFFAPKGRRAANEYWRLIRPDAGFLARQFMVGRQFLVFAKILLDRVYQSHQPAPVFKFEGHGNQNIYEPVRAGQGLVLLSAHVGAWDLAAACLKADGMPGQFHMVRYEADGMTMERVKDRSDSGHLEAVASNRNDQAVLQIRQLLAEGKPVGLMADRPLANHFELVLFMGRLAPMDCTPFRVAAACRAPLLFSFGFKGQGTGPELNYEFYATPAKPYTYSSGKNKLLQCQEWAQEFAEVLESYVRRYPEQWTNFYPFWSFLPQPPAGVAVSKSRNYLLEELSKQKVLTRESESPQKSNVETGFPH